MRYSDTVLGLGPTLGDWLHSRVDQAEYAAIRTGFLSLAAVEAEMTRLRAVLQRGGQLLIVAGGAEDQADPDALIKLGELLEPFGDRGVLRVIVEPDEFQNAKTYFLRFADDHAEAWVGSANFTIGGLANNHEASVYLDSREPADTEALENILRGIEIFRNRPGATGVSQETRLVLKSRQRRYTRRADQPRIHPTRPWVDCLQPTMDQVEHVANDPIGVSGVPTGFVDLDEMTGGLQQGTLTVVGSRPGVGRSTLVLDFARAAAIRHRCRTALFCLDQTGQDVVQRVLSAEAKVRRADMRSGRMTDGDWTRLARRMADISEAPLLLNTTPAADLDALCTEVVRLNEGEHLNLVVVDPINMIKVKIESGANRERELSVITRRLKTLALELAIPIAVTAELGRTVEARVDHRPTLGDLREADILAQVADTVILLHRPDYYERDDPRAGEADLIVTKHREGPIATITVAHQLHYSRFADLAIRPGSTVGPQN